ncbi:MAG: CDP-archaeol synthase [Rhabdochlamydiaceae bacterium]|nr:CDP-archaeol synthase [Candidatus Amphrikana amoebophyrae]
MTKQRVNKQHRKKQSPFRDLKNRAWVSVCVGLIALVLIYFAQNSFVQVILSIALTAFIGIALYEWVLLLEKKRIRVARKLVFGFAIIWMISTYLSVLSFDMTSFNMLIVALFLFLLCLSSFRYTANSLATVASTFFGIVYVVVPLSLMLYIVYPESIALSDNGRMWLAYLLIVTKITDMGGYFIGKMWGKNKMAPHLSPHKTMEGAIGGLVLALISSVVFFIMGWLMPSLNFSLTLLQSICMGIVLGVVGQLGDLTESLFKRDANIKDSNSIPGFGGILDLFDSLIFTTPALFLFMKIV